MCATLVVESLPWATPIRWAGQATASGGIAPSSSLGSTRDLSTVAIASAEYPHHAEKAKPHQNSAPLQHPVKVSEIHPILWSYTILLTLPVLRSCILNSNSEDCVQQIHSHDNNRAGVVAP